MKRNIFVLGVAVLLALPIGGLSISAALAAPTYVGIKGGNVAVSGYDPVTYFVGNGTPSKGEAKFAVEHDGAVYHFVSEENANRFSADPAAFAPQFGGHCAWAMGRGYLAPGDPEQYAVVDGKLYLNFNAAVKAKWDAGREGFIKSGHKNWANLPADAKFGG